MSEILGDADPLEDADPDDRIDDDDEVDEDELEEEFDRAYAASGWSTTLTSPVTLSIAALALAVVSLIGLLSTYLVVNSIAVTHPAATQVFGVRVTAFVELGLALVAVLLAYLAHSGARIDPELQAHRVARWLAGAALLLAVVSIAESVISLLITIGAHAPAGSGG